MDRDTVSIIHLTKRLHEKLNFIGVIWPMAYREWHFLISDIPKWATFPTSTVIAEHIPFAFDVFDFDTFLFLGVWNFGH